MSYHPHYYIYRSYDKSDKEHIYLDSLGQDYFGKRVRTTVTLLKDTVEQVDKYRKPLGLSRSRYIDYVIATHFSIVDQDDDQDDDNKK